MCPSANTVRVKDKLILRVMTWAFIFRYNRLQNLILWDRAPLRCGKERTRIGSTVY